MADENTPAFYPRVGRTIAKNFRSAQPPAFIEDPRAMELPQYVDSISGLGKIDLRVPSKENRELNRRITERDADLMRQVQADRSIPEKLAGGLQAGRFIGSAILQDINAMPTRIFGQGTAAERETRADKLIEDRLYKPTQPLAYEYTQDVMDFLDKLETDYKIPPLLPEALPLQYLTGPATAQAMKAAGKGALKAGMAIERGMEPVVKGALERGGLPREMVMAMGANTQSNVMKPSNKANWMSGPNIHVPEGDAWRFKTQTVAGETPAERIPRHEELLNDPTLNQDQIDRVLYQLELAKGEAALDKWADNALMGYFKGQLASPEDPVRLMIEKNYANIEAKFAKDQERATKMAQRAEAELDPRKQANMKRQADTMFVQARDDRDIAMQNISHLPSEMLQDITLDPKSYIKEERVKAGYPAEGLGTTDPSRKWEHQADEAVKVTRAGDIQAVMDLQPKIDQALQDQLVVYQKLNKEWGNLLRSKGLQEKDIAALMTSMPRNTKAEAVGMLDELQQADSNYLRLLDQDRSFPKFASMDNPFVAKLDPETKMYSGYMGDLGFEHVMDVLRQDLAAERLRPEQLNKLSVEQAVKRTQEYNLDLAKKMNADRASARADLPVYKEYPDGYKWVQLNKPGNFAAESEAMGHSVKGYEPSKKHPEWVKGSGDEGSPSYGLGGWEAIKSGRAKIYSLVDSRGAPHATIEVASGAHPIGYSFKGASKELPETFEYNRNFDEGFPRPTEEQKQAILSRAQDIFKNNSNIERMDAFQMAANEVLGELPAEIRQIKGKGNVKPIADYIPYVQDFVKSGKWTDVRDFSNTDLIRADDVRKAGWDMTGIDSLYLTKQEYDDLLLNELNKPKGMKRGGKVSISNNPDTMMLEVNNQKMSGGGLTGSIKRSLKAAKPEAMKASEALGKIEGRPLKITQADRTKVGGGYLGGPGFSGLQLTEPEYRAAEAAWAVQNAGTAKTILGGGKKGDDAVYSAMIGTPTQHQSNQMVFDKLLGDFKKAAKRGELTPELRDLINTRLAASVDKKGNPVFPADVDIMDKNFRNIADTFSRRSIAGHLMGGVQVGGKKGQIIDYDKIIRNTTDPDLIDLPTGSIGNRLFTLSGGIIDRPDLHPAFPAILQGEDLGLTFSPVERDIVMKDFVAKTMREKGRKPGYMDYSRGNPPTQLITEDILTEMQKLGLKKGGAVNKAEGGYLKKPAAYINGDEFVNAAKKYGIKDSMNNLNKIVDLVNKGLSVDDAARQVADSGMHKAAGGAISGDDLILEERPL